MSSWGAHWLQEGAAFLTGALQQEGGYYNTYQWNGLDVACVLQRQRWWVLEDTPLSSTNAGDACGCFELFQVILGIIVQCCVHSAKPNG